MGHTTTLSIEWWNNGQHVATYRNLLHAAAVRHTIGSTGTWVLTWT